MSDDLKICFDRILPSDLRRLNRPEFSAANPEAHSARAALFRAKKWPVGVTLKVRFLGGTSQQQGIVRQFVPEWSQFANIKFNFTNATDAEIRITFAANLGAWSYIGTDALNIPSDTATMNLGWQDEAVVLHEFGHAIGLIHEHQNPFGGIKWNRPAVIKDLGGPPNNWDLPTIENNMFRTYSKDQLNGTDLDKFSIMMYRIPASWTTDGFSTEFNAVLSQTDKSFIGSEVNYPFGDDQDTTPVLTVNELVAQSASIGQAGEQDLYRFTVSKPGVYTIETTGPTDLLMSLYGPDSQTTLVAEDDDSGQDRNARIMADLTTTGTYYVQVRHYNRTSGIGEYRIMVSRPAE